MQLDLKTVTQDENVEQLVLYISGQKPALHAHGFYRNSQGQEEAECEVLLEPEALVFEQVLDGISARSLGFRGGYGELAGQELDAVKRIGGEIFNALLRSKIGPLYLKAVSKAKGEGSGVRIAVHPQTEDAAALPWEILYDTVHFNFVALSSRTLLVRLAEGPNKESIREPCEVLVAAADVNGLIEPEREIKLLEQLSADSGGKLKITAILRDATPSSLLDLIARQDYHVLHFTGTGIRHSEALSLFGGILPATSIMKALGYARALRMVCLSADYSDDVARQVASSVPATLGIRELISAVSAEVFTRVLYESMIRGETFEGAITRGRQALETHNPGIREWGLIRAYSAGPVRLVEQEQYAAQNLGTVPERKDASRHWLKLNRELKMHQHNLKALLEISSHTPETASQIRGLKDRINQIQVEMGEV